MTTTPQALHRQVVEALQKIRRCCQPHISTQEHMIANWADAALAALQSAHIAQEPSQPQAEEAAK